MTYMLLVNEPRGQREQRSDVEGRAAYASMEAYADMLRSRELLQAYSSLRGDAEGKRIQVRSGKRRVHDGPFTEAREMIGGFFLLDCASLEEALKLAAQCPAAEWATIEVRQTGPCYLRDSSADL